MTNCEITTNRSGTWFGNIVRENNNVFIVAMATENGFNAVMGENGYLQLRVLRENRVYRVRIINFNAPIQNLEIPFQVM